MTHMRDPRPPRMTPPRPMYDDDEEYYDGPGWPPPPPGGGGGFEADRSLLKVAAVILGLAVVIIILILPPISILDKGDGKSASSGGITTKARGSIPTLPEGLEAASALYDIKAPDSLSGAATLTVRLSQQTEDGR